MAYYNYNIIYIINTIRQSTIRITLLTLTFITIILFSSLAQGTDAQLANEYVLKGDKKKALELYRDLAKNDANTATIYNNFINLLVDLEFYDEARNYLKKISKKDPTNLQYELDYGLVTIRAGELGKADKYFKDVITANKGNTQRTKIMADYFMSRSLIDYGVLALTESRQHLGNPQLFALDLAMLYRVQGKQDNMVQEYLSYVTQNAGNIQYVKNVLQILLTKPEELESLERLLYDKVQRYPDVEVYADLLIWVTMQQKNFYASFIQARAYDKRYRHDGDKSMEVARVAMDNEDYEVALRIYRQVIRDYPNTDNYLLARLGLIRTQEARVKNTYPVKKDSVKILIRDYKEFINAFPANANALEASRSQALLLANYLDEKDEAATILTNLIDNPRATQYLKAKAKIDLGDIYLLRGESWESTLLYSQVEKTQKENILGYEAKLKNAKLSYYKGDFRLAQEHLDILKQATSREIANDAMELSMRIKENIAFDSVGEALKQYALIELLLFQNKTDLALQKISMLKEGRAERSKEDTFLLGKSIDDSTYITFPNHTILDDVYWLEANIRIQQGNFEQAISLLQKIRDEYPDDVLADDAFFTQGEIYERHLKMNVKAMEIYREFLNTFPGSVYAAEARKRFRRLRGDFTDQDNPQL